MASSSSNYVDAFKAIIDEIVVESKIKGTTVATTVVSVMFGKEYYIRRFGGFLWDHRDEVVGGEWKDIITGTYEKQILKYADMLKIPQEIIKIIIYAIRDKFAEYVNDPDKKKLVGERCCELLNLYIKWVKEKSQI